MFRQADGRYLLRSGLLAMCKELDHRTKQDIRNGVVPVTMTKSPLKPLCR